AFMQNALEYQMSLGFLDSKFSGMKKALRGD
ncbi:MAG: flagellar basal body rod protein FlgB, partial [Shewanella xiamenensis]|nr:flagellar basal body rod protein FlgB [Shewanella xiamenensis]